MDASHLKEYLQEEFPSGNEWIEPKPKDTKNI